MKYLKSLIIFLLLIISGCESPTSVKSGQPPADIEEQLNRVDIVQVDYYSILFRNSDSLFIDGSTIEKLIFGYYADQVFAGIDTVSVLHAVSSSLLTFSDTITVADSLLNITVGLKYILKNYNPYTVKKDFFLFSFPYETTKEIISYSSFLLNNDIQDFVYRFPQLYYHPFGSNGLYRHNVETNENELLIDYPGGDFIDGTSEYIFADLHDRIKRFNLQTNEVDAEIFLSDNFPDILIEGIAVNDSEVFVITKSPDKLLTLNSDLEIVNTKDFPFDSYYSMTYNNGYLFTLKYERDNRYHIVKFNAATGEIVNENKTPTLHTCTIKIFDDALYFIDENQKLLCYTWLDEIFPN